MNNSPIVYELSGGPADGNVVTFSKRVLAVGVVFSSDDATSGPCGRLAIYRPSPTTCGFDLATFDCIREVPAVGPALRLDGRCFQSAGAADHGDVGRILFPDEVKECRRATASWPMLGHYAGTVGHVPRSPSQDAPESEATSTTSTPAEDIP